VPWGAVHSKKGEFIVDDEAARAMIAAFDAHGNTVPIDWEHEGLKGGRADAAGWVERLWAAPGVGIKALVKWTDKAREAIRSDAYRYLSPVLLIDRATKRALGLHSAALTNAPAIPRMEKLAASTRGPNETEKELLAMADDDGGGASRSAEVKTLLGKLQALLGLEENTAALDVLKAAVERLTTLLEEDKGEGSEDKEVAQSVRALLGLPVGAPRSAVILAMKTRDLNGAGTALVEMRQAEAERIATEHVARHVKDFKLTVNDKDAMGAALELARTNPDLLDQLMANAASVMPPQGKTTAPSHADMSRTRTIVGAARDYRDDAGLRKTTSAEAYINLELREHGMQVLSEDECREYIVA
ncbi:MAG: phage protease, partial [Phycisphaerae bacterium]